MNPTEIILTIILIAAVTAVTAVMIHRKRKGKSSCSCGCESCPSRSMCSSKASSKK